MNAKAAEVKGGERSLRRNIESYRDRGDHMEAGSRRIAQAFSVVIRTIAATMEIVAIIWKSAFTMHPSKLFYSY